MQRAFTLVELLVTMAVLVLLGSFVIPTYQTILSELQLSSAVEQVAEQTRLAQQRTVTEQQVYGVTYTVGANTVPLYSMNGATKTAVSTISLPAYVSISTVSFSGNADIRFAPSGAPNYSGYLVLRDIIRNRYRRIELRPSGTIITTSAKY
jgi:prepilin-type N-terminal cleavage/methylation domain-containing protein